MADEIIRGGGADTDYDGCDVSALAGDTEDWGVVSQYGVPGADRVVLRDGDLPVTVVLRDGPGGAAGVMAVPEFI